MKLREYLSGRSGDVLKCWLSMLQISTSGITRKEQMVEALERHLFRDVSGYLSFLNAQEKAFLAECVHAGRVPSAEGFKAKYGHSVYPEVRDRWSTEARAIKRYVEIVVGQVAPGQGMGVAVELIEPLKSALPRPAAVSVKGLAALPGDSIDLGERGSGGRRLHVYESEKASRQELMRVLRLVQAGRIEASESSGRPTSTSIRAVTEILVLPDYDLEEPPEPENSQRLYRTEPDHPGPVRAHAWPVVIQQCGWAKRRGKVLRLTPAGEALIARFDVQQFEAGLIRLTFENEFDELNRIPVIRGQSGNAKRHLTPPGSRREPIFEGLGGLPANTWISFTEVLRYLRATGARWPVGGGGCLYLGELQYGAIYDQAPLEAQYLRGLLMETLATLGLLDIAYTYPAGLVSDFHDAWGIDGRSYISRYDGLQYVRITPLGAFVLAASDRKPAYKGPTSEAIFTLSSTNELVPVLRELDAATRAYLEQFAEPRKGGTWRIDERKILNHLAAGVSTEEVLSWVKLGLATELPETLSDFIAGLNTRREACLGMEDAVIIRWLSADLLRVILDFPEVDKLAQAYGRTAIVTPRKNLTALRKALLAQGFVLPVER